MKINFVVSKTYNLFHFLQNMSEWSKYIRTQENRDWISETGLLDIDEKTALAKVANVLKAYDYNRPVGDCRNIFEFFAIAGEVAGGVSKLSDLIGQEEARDILEAMEILSPRFEKIWDRQKLNFEAKKQLILSNLHEKEISTDVNRLFGLLKFPEAVSVYFVLNTKQYASGGANIGASRVTLECSSVDNICDIMTILWHETTHLILADYVREVFELTGKKTASREFVNEVLAHSLFGTFGVLTHKYYSTQNLVRTKELVANYLETGVTSESGKEYIEKLPFGFGPYYMSRYIEEKFTTGEIITPEEAAEVIIEVHQEA